MSVGTSADLQAAPSQLALTPLLAERGNIKEVLSIQYLRGCAALLVVIFHMFTIGELSYLYRSDIGGFGVEIFFVISGFIMWHTTVASRITPAVFWRNRVIRIVPLYWFFLALMIVICLSIPQMLNSTILTAEGVVKSFLFIPYYNAVAKNGIAPILVPGWSLNYEMFFYFIFGLSLFVRYRPARLALLSVILIGLVVAGFVLQPTEAVLVSYTNSAILTFFEGVVLAVLYRRFGFHGVGWAVTLIIVGIAGQATRGGGIGWVYAVSGLSPALVVAGALCLEPSIQRAPNSLLRLVGDASYSIYLSHLFFIRAAEMLWRRLGMLGSGGLADATFVIVGVGFAVLGGVVVHLVIERPMLSGLRKLAGRSAQGARDRTKPGRGSVTDCTT
jgi:peptidoglycan/LPS O-acetylase OafA/YrhL